MTHLKDMNSSTSSHCIPFVSQGFPAQECFTVIFFPNSFHSELLYSAATDSVSSICLTFFLLFFPLYFRYFLCQSAKAQLFTVCLLDDSSEIIVGKLKVSSS